MGPRDAARRTMDEVGTAVISIAIVLVSVFIPSAAPGRHHRRVLSPVRGHHCRGAPSISAFNSLTLSPALCALLMHPAGGEADRLDRNASGRIQERLEQFKRPLQSHLRPPQRLALQPRVASNIRRPKLMLGAYAVLIALAAVMFWKTPRGFHPAP